MTIQLILPQTKGGATASAIQPFMADHVKSSVAQCQKARMPSVTAMVNVIPESESVSVIMVTMVKTAP